MRKRQKTGSLVLTKSTLIQSAVILFLMIGFRFNAQQIHVNREWETSSGNPVFNPLLSPYGGDWTRSIFTLAYDVVTVGHTAVSGQGENILISKRTEGGMLIWETNYNSGSSFNDYAVDVLEDGSGNIYVCGTTDNGGTTNYDIIVLVYDSNGSLQYSTSYNGPNGLNDIASSMKFDSNGNILIAGTRESTATSYDYFIISYDPTLSMNWRSTYDYNSLYDFAAGIEIEGGTVRLAGSSASSGTDWDYAVASFDESTGNYISDTRDNLPGVGYDQVFAFKKDAAGNTYITGKASANGTNYDIRTIMLSPSNTTVWVQTYDGHGLEDIGSSLAIDSNGDVIVGGYSTKTNNKKEIIVLKYNSSGTLLWKHVQSSNDISDDAQVKSIALNPTTNDIYFIGGEKAMNGGKRSIVARMYPNGRVGWEKYIQGNYDYLPSDIQYGGFGTPGVYAIAIKDSTINSYKLNHFTEHELDTATTYAPNGMPAFPSRQLITRFDTSALIKPMIDNRNIVCGPIEDFIKSGVVSSLKANLATIYGVDEFDIKVYKIFPEIGTSDTKTISRLGDTIPIPEFFSILLLELPTSLNVISAANSMQSLFPNIIYTHPNWACSVTATCSDNNLSKVNISSSDSLYSEQSSLHSTSSYTNAHVNAEEAWDIETGKRHVKVGVFDTGAFWGHTDFMDSTMNITKITGWDFINNAPLINDPVGESLNHGTQVSGIISGNRNNIKGIAGIAGGNFKQSSFLDSSGVKLHAMRVFLGFGEILHPTYLNYVANAIITSAIDDPNNEIYKYGLHIMNNSWRVNNTKPYFIPYMSDSNMTILREAVHFVNRAKVTFVAATGNEASSTQSYPATIDDAWVLTVGGTGNNGQWHSTVANYKNNIDIAAPSSEDIIRTTGWALYQYWGVEGTSMAAPHVSAAAGLLMSYVNKPYAHPDNLAPEDVEAILQTTATDVNSVGYDTLTGYGRLNIGKAMALIKKPKRKVLHFSTDNSSHIVTKTLWPTPDTIKLTERYKNAAGNWFVPNKKYVVSRYIINTYVYYSLPSASTTILHSWPRHSSTTVLENILYGKLSPRERVTSFVLNQSGGYASMSGHVYKVKDTLGNVLGWWPFDTSSVNLKFAYTLLINDSASDVNIHENILSKPKLKVYPNPTKENQILEITTLKSTSCKVDIYDLLGRNVFSLDRQKISEGINRIPIPTNSLPKGMYIYYVKMDEEQHYYKILKE